MSVFVLNKSGHDFSAAERYGKLIFLSQGKISPYSVTKMFRDFVFKMKNSTKDDFILLTGLSTMAAIACSCFVYKHGRLNLLLFKDNHYIERHLVFDELIQKDS